jgi:hypothetical protein
MDWGSEIPGVGGEPWEVGRGESGLCGADGHRLTDPGGCGLAVHSGTGEREWLRASVCECARVRAPRAWHSLLGPHLLPPSRVRARR